MLRRHRAEALARLSLSIAALLPYAPLLTLRTLFVTDDFFASDIFNGELPGRVIGAHLLRQGEWPVWTSQLCSGSSLAGLPADPLGLAAFVILPTAPALDLYVIALLLIAAHGAYSFAERLGADRIGAVLAGVAFAGSGYFACQLKHLAIVATVVWLPVGLTLLDCALAPGEPVETRDGPARSLALAGFGLVFAQQVLAGFPQSAYICALVYGTYAIVGVIAAHHPRRRALRLLAGALAAVLLGAAAGAVVLLPIWHLGQISDRANGLRWEWLERTAYWPPNVLTFLIPYVNGDVSNGTYRGPLLFWEDYGYVGLAPFLLAFYGGLREWPRTIVKYLVGLSMASYLMVLGPATPVFRLVYVTVPGMSLFRFPTRFLVVVELGIAVLGALGLTCLRRDVERMWQVRPNRARLAALLVCAGTTADLLVQQPRQNAMVLADPWLTPPASVAAVHADVTAPRTFTPDHRNLHRASFFAARGWSDVGPYFALRSLLEPNTGGGFWETPSADCYSGIAPAWYVDVWGDHNRDGAVIAKAAKLDFRAHRLDASPAFGNVLRTFGVTHVLSPYDATAPSLKLTARDGWARVYRVADSARVRIVRAARPVADDQEATSRLLDQAFDPDAEILLQGAPPSLSSISSGAPTSGTARIVAESSRTITVAVQASAPAFLLLADTFFPGWTASVDAQPTPIYRADVSLRGITVPQGKHLVQFSYEAPGVRLGGGISVAAITVMIAWAILAGYSGGRSSRWRQRPRAPQNPITT